MKHPGHVRHRYSQPLRLCKNQVFFSARTEARTSTRRPGYTRREVYDNVLYRNVASPNDPMCPLLGNFAAFLSLQERNKHVVASFFIARAKLSVPINGIFVPFKTVADAIRRFCTPAFFHHKDQAVFDLSRMGSAFLFRYRARNIALLTRHQLGRTSAVRPEQFTVTLIEPGGAKVGLSPNAVTKVQMENIEHSNLEDVLLLEYDNIRGTRNLRGLFLDLDLAHTLETVAPASVKAIFSVGYPTAYGDVDFKCDDEGNATDMNMELRWVKLDLTPDKPALRDPENRRPMI